MAALYVFDPTTADHCMCLFSVLQVLASAPGDRVLALRGWAALYLLTLDEVRNKRRAIAAGVESAMSRGLAASTTDKSVRRLILLNLSSLLSADANFARACGESGMAEQLVECLRDNDALEILLLAYENVLAMASEVKDNCERMAQAGVIDTLVRRMRVQDTTKEVQGLNYRCAVVIATSSKATCDALLREGAFEVIIQRAMSTPPSDARESQQLLKFLQAVTLNDPANLARLRVDGFCETLIRVWRSFRDDTSVLVGIDLIALLAEDDALNVSLAKARAAELLVEAIKSSATNELIQERGWKAAYGLTLDNLVSRQQVGAAGGCAALTKSMRLYPQNERLQLACCAAAKAWLGDESFRTLLGDAGLGELLVKALKAFPESEDLLSTGTEVVTMLATDNAENAQRLGNVGACEILVARARLMISARKAVNNLTAGMAQLAMLSPDNCVRMVDMGLSETAVKILRRYPKDSPIQFNVIQTIAAVLCSQDDPTALGKVGACPALVDACKNFPSQVALVTLAFRSLTLLAAQADDLKREQTEAGVCQALLDAMSFFEEDMTLNLRALELASVLARDSLASARLVGSGATEAIILRVRRYQGDQEVLNKGLEALAAIYQHAQASRSQLVASGLYEAAKLGAATAGADTPAHTISNDLVKQLEKEFPNIKSAPPVPEKKKVTLNIFSSGGGSSSSPKKEQREPESPLDSSGIRRSDSSVSVDTTATGKKKKKGMVGKLKSLFRSSSKAIAEEDENLDRDMDLNYDEFDEEPSSPSLSAANPLNSSRSGGGSPRPASGHTQYTNPLANAGAGRPQDVDLRGYSASLSAPIFRPAAPQAAPPPPQQQQQLQPLEGEPILDYMDNDIRVLARMYQLPEAELIKVRGGRCVWGGVKRGSREQI
jgi:hypothetical protein